VYCSVSNSLYYHRDTLHPSCTDRAEIQSKLDSTLMEMIYNEMGWISVPRDRYEQLVLKALKINKINCLTAFTERSIWLQEPSVVAELRFNEDRIMNTPTV